MTHVMKLAIFKTCRTARWHLSRNWWLQALLFIAIWALGEAVVRQYSIPIPGSVLGMGALLAALELRWISVRWFRRGARGLLAHLLLFLTPAMLAVVNHRELISMTGLKLIVAVLIGTPLVMIGTAVVVEIGFRLQPIRER